MNSPKVKLQRIILVCVLIVAVLAGSVLLRIRPFDPSSVDAYSDTLFTLPVASVQEADGPAMALSMVKTLSVDREDPYAGTVSYRELTEAEESLDIAIEAEEEAERIAAEERAAAEKAAKKADAAAKKKAEQEAKKKAAEEAARKKAEEEARKKAEEEARKKAEEEAKKAEEEARKKAEEEARRKAEEESKNESKSEETEAERAAREEAERKAAEEAAAAAAEKARKFDLARKGLIARYDFTATHTFTFEESDYEYYAEKGKSGYTESDYNKKYNEANSTYLETDYLVALCYREASTNYSACLAVANVVLNRLYYSNYYKCNTICEVIYKKGQFTTAKFIYKDLEGLSASKYNAAKKAVAAAIAGINNIGSRTNFRSNSAYKKKVAGYTAEQIARLNPICIIGNTYWEYLGPAWKNPPKSATEAELALLQERYDAFMAKYG